MEWNDAIAALGRFGLSEREAALYLVALRRGAATARELTGDARVERVLGYRLLDGMRARGLVLITAERPRRYTPLAPRLLLERNLHERRLRLGEDEKLSHRIAEELDGAAVTLTSAAARYQIVGGSRRAYDTLREMVGRAATSLDVMLTFRGLRESLDHGLGASVSPFVRKGGRVRLLLESDPRLPVALARFRRTVRRYPHVEIREVTPQPSRLTVVDRSEALLFVVPDLRDATTEQVALWTDHPAFVSGQSLVFERAWKSARAAPVKRRRIRRPP
ncbi:MAG TPA: helix-turn-helix domain-containing protein [Thermoplasmata archaeon]|nr:helix-turn-helix domain-containing protein [Thermoplasmata archaeon]